MPLMFDAKVALYEALKGLALPDVQVTYAATGKADRRAQLWLGDTTDEDLQVVAMRQGPRKPTSVSGFIDACALVVSPGDPIHCERAVYVLRDHIVRATVAIDRAAIPGLLDVRAESSSCETAETTDGAYAALTVRVRVRGRII